MDKRINKIVEEYTSAMKAGARNYVLTYGTGIDVDEIDNGLLQYICDYPSLSLEKVDFAKRKRVKNIVYFADRCCAKRANGEQCTRRKRSDEEYCGTHVKGTPHGIFDTSEEKLTTNTRKVEVWAEDIQGIWYYIDNNGNAYHAEDVMSGVENPKISAKYIKDVNNVYSIVG